MTAYEPVEIAAGAYQLRPWPVANADLDEVLADFCLDPTARAGIAAFQGPLEETVAALRVNRLTGWETGDYLGWGIREATTGRCVGEVTLIKPDLKHQVVMIGYATRSADRGRGVMSSAVPAACRWGFEGLGMYRISLGHMVGNTGSRRIAEKCGFTYEGTSRGDYLNNGEHQDTVWWSRLAID